MNIIKIKPNKNGDSRVADHVPTIEEFKEANMSDSAQIIRDYDRKFGITRDEVLRDIHANINLLKQSTNNAEAMLARLASLNFKIKHLLYMSTDLTHSDIEQRISDRYNREVRHRKSGLKRVEAQEKLDSEYGLRNIGASAMLIKALTLKDVYTLDIVQMYTREEVMDFKYIGPKTIDELSNLMDKYGFKFKEKKR